MFFSQLNIFIAFVFLSNLIEVLLFLIGKINVIKEFNIFFINN